MKSQCFHDFDAFAASVRDVDSKMLLRNPQNRTWITSSVDLGEIDIQLGQLGSGNIAQGQLRPDGFLIYLPLTDGVQYSANGVVIDRGSFTILEPGCEFCISTKVEHDWCAAFVPTRIFTADGDLAWLSNSRPNTCRVTQSNQRSAVQFSSAVSEIMAAAAQCPRFEASPAAASAKAAILQIASAVVGRRHVSQPQQTGRPLLARREIIDRCMQQLEEREFERVSVGDLAMAAKVSERTVRNAFNEYFGIGPIHYLQLRQLHQVHWALRAADPEIVSVTDVLVAHGEWEFSRFASRYRRLFGELPSETLRGELH